MRRLAAFLSDPRAAWVHLLAPIRPIGALAGSDAGPDAHLLLFSASSPDPEDKRTVRVRRRRTSGPDSSGPRERADTPEREAAPPTTSGSGGGTPPGGTRPRPGGLPLPGGGPRLSLPIIAIIVLLVICIGPFLLFQGSDEAGPESAAPPQPAEQAAQSTAPQAPRATPRPTATHTAAGAAAPATGDGATWLVMLYQDADDKILEKDIVVDLNEAERAGSSDRVHIVSQIDRFRGAYQGDGDWTTARRYYLTQDDDLNRTRTSQMVDLGEVNMADGDTLVDFVTWAMAAYPADKYALILSDHGMGWPGGWSDPTATGGTDRTIPLTSALGDQLYLHELDTALDEIRALTGLDKFELIGMDACLMGHLEVFAALAPHARYAVASQETEPALGWAYTSFLNTLLQQPDMDGAELSRAIVESYIREDQRIVDDQARADLVGRGAPMGSLFSGLAGPSAAEVARQMEQNVTLTAVDLAALPELMDRLNELAYTLQEVNPKAVSQARGYAQSFTSIFGSQVPPSYIDLGNFVQLLAQASRSADITAAADQVLAALGQAVIAEKNGPNKPGATGVSIYFPNSALYRSAQAGPESYTAIARRFAEQSLWDDFLAFHYTGRAFEAAATELAVPARGATVAAPVTSPIDVSPVTASDATAAPGQPILLSVDLAGENIGYVKLFVGFYDRDANSVFMADTDYLESDDTREVDGVYYPDWGEGPFTMEFEWEPIVFAISDGQTTAEALFTPETYGQSRTEAVYTVDGTYTYGDDGETRPARLYFQDGALRQVFGFTGDGQNGAPREIIPQPGDRFTVLETWMDLDASGQVAQTATQAGETLTFGREMFTWRELDAAAGEYLVGFLVEDLDGNATPAFTPVTVQ